VSLAAAPGCLPVLLRTCCATGTSGPACLAACGAVRTLPARRCTCSCGPTLPLALTTAGCKPSDGLSTSKPKLVAPLTVCSRMKYRHRWTGKWEAHLWDKSVTREKQASGGRTRGKQVYLGGFATEEQAARAYDRAAIVQMGAEANLNVTPPALLSIGLHRCLLPYNVNGMLCVNLFAGSA
jgi:hypothetical protein